VRGDFKARMENRRNNKQKFVLVGFLTIILGLFLNMIYINVAHGDEFERRAIRQQATHNGVDVVVNPNRGSITDRNGQVLASSVTVYNIILDVRDLFNEPMEIQERTVNILHDMLGTSTERMWGYLEPNPENPYVATRNTHYLVLERQVPRGLAHELMAELTANRRRARVFLGADSLRSYPHGMIAGPLVGFVRGDNSSWGLERQYYEELAGIPGRNVRMFDENGNAFTRQIAPQTGHTLVTTLDLTIQQFAIEIAEEYGTLHNAQSASVIVMNPNTGEILAMAQYPTFDPNAPFNTDLINSQRVRNELNAVPETQLMNELFNVWSNHTISRSVEPGSIFKPIIAAAALEEGLVFENETFFCSGAVTVSGVRIPCWNASGHGLLTLSGSMAISCNTSIIQIAERMGRDLVYEYMRDFGVGQLTGVDLHGEFSVFPLTYTRAQLNPVELATSAMGQGFNMTPLQAINSFAAIINGGNLMQPYIVSQIVDTQNNVISETKPTVKRRVISQETSDFWREEMVHTFSNRGTGTAARIEGFEIGGKTGTAQRGDRRSGEYTLSFISYFPASNPQYIMMVMLDKPMPFIQGVTSAQPMLRDLMERIIRYRAIPPENVGNSVAVGVGNGTVIVENYVGRTLNETIRSLHNHGLVFEVIGNGNIIMNQQPLHDSRVAVGSRIFLYLTNEEDSNYELTLIPDVRGMTINQATETLRNANLSYTVIEHIENEDNEDLPPPAATRAERVVLVQMPSSGIRVVEDTEISIIVR